MDNIKIGLFISNLRKEKSMTQKDLADKLNATSKAVSKWETGQGYPEITTIPMLAEILGVTAGELLNGELNTKESNDMVVSATIINETVNYLKETSSKSRDTAFLVISIIILFSGFVCLLCNYLVNRVISWSLYPIGALVVLWAMIFPFFKMKKNKSIGFLLGLTVTLIPYLFLLQSLTPVKGWVMPLALPVTVISLIALGITLVLFNYTKLNKFYSISITVFLFGVVVEMSVEKIVESFLKSSGENDISVFVTVLTSAFISVVLFAVRYRKMKDK